MRTLRFVSLVALFLLHAGCDSGGTTDTLAPTDAGAESDAYQVFDGGGPAPTPPNGASACPAGPCNYQTGSGCTATQTCTPNIANDAAVPACMKAGSGVSGAACTSDGDCAAGLLCSNDGACHKLCCGGDWSGCGSPNEHCIDRVIYSLPNGKLDTGAMLCMEVNNCDALAPGSCKTPGTTCQIVDPTGATACFPEGTGDVGQPCPCKGGFTCVGGACHRLCKAIENGGAPYCQPGEGACVHFTKDPPGVGECVAWN